MKSEQAGAGVSLKVLQSVTKQVFLSLHICNATKRLWAQEPIAQATLVVVSGCCCQAHRFCMQGLVSAGSNCQAQKCETAHKGMAAQADGSSVQKQDCSGRVQADP